MKIGGQPVALKNQSYFKSSPLGNEAATRSFGAGVVTHQISGKTHFAAWSMDVKVEGQNVPRNLDITTSNHGSDPGNTLPIPEIDKAAPGGGDEKDEPKEDDAQKCGCCDGPAHSQAQKEGKEISFQEFYQPEVQSRAQQEVVGNAKAAIELIRGTPKCKDILPPDPPGDDPCSKHYVASGTESKKSRRDFESLISPLTPDSELGGRKELAQKLRVAKGRGGQIAHRTALAAGGCPVGENNLHPVTDPECLFLEKELGSIQGELARIHRKRLGL